MEYRVYCELYNYRIIVAEAYFVEHIHFFNFCVDVLNKGHGLVQMSNVVRKLVPKNFDHT